MIDSWLHTAHSLLLNEQAYKTLVSDKFKPLYVHEWLTHVDKELTSGSVPIAEIKKSGAQLVAQLLGLLHTFPGPPIRHLVGKNAAAVLSATGDTTLLYPTVDKCHELVRSREHETQMQQMAKLCALSVLGSLYERPLLARLLYSSHQETVAVLLKYMKKADALVTIEIIGALERMFAGLAGQFSLAAIKDVHKQLKKQLAAHDGAQQQRYSLAVRVACVRCLAEMAKHSTYLYMPTTTTSASMHASASTSSLPSIIAAASSNSSSMALVSSELSASVQLAIKALDASNYEVRCAVASYLAQLIFYSLSHLQRQQQLLLQQQQIANASAAAGGGGGGASGANDSSSSGATASSSNQAESAATLKQQQRQQAALQQQNQHAQAMMADKMRNTLGLLAAAFNKPLNVSSGFSLASLKKSSSSSSAAVASSSRKVASSSAAAAASSSSAAAAAVAGASASLATAGAKVAAPASASASASSTQINREARIGVTYAYVELANLLGSAWLERHMRLFVTHVLLLVNNTRCVQNHVDAVHSRKCVQYVLRRVVGGMLTEQVQVQVARELIAIVDRCLSGQDIAMPSGARDAAGLDAASVAHIKSG